MKRKTYLIYGISKGLGKRIAQDIPNAEDYVYGVSRTKPDFEWKQENSLIWIPADLAQPLQGLTEVKNVIQEKRVDYLIYNVGIWEHNAFEPNYNFADNSAEEILNMIQVNISSCILAVQHFVENLKKSTNAKVILIGSTWGLDNHGGKEVVFSATKYALRGITHALRENFREHKIGVSVLNLGYLDTQEQGDEALIPVADVLQAIRFILATSNQTCIKEINMPAMQDRNS